jgi:hypothetical protein
LSSPLALATVGKMLDSLWPRGVKAARDRVHNSVSRRLIGDFEKGCRACQVASFRKGNLVDHSRLLRIAARTSGSRRPWTTAMIQSGFLSGA